MFRTRNNQIKGIIKAADYLFTDWATSLKEKRLSDAEKSQGSSPW